MPTPNESGRATFTVPLADIKFDASGDPAADGAPTMRGHAAVWNRLSHDLGGFRVKIAPVAFDRVLDSNPDVHLLWDHNTRYVLARTKNKTLELRSDPLGLHVWARMANTATAKELATLMDGGFVDQMSVSVDIGSATWTEDDQGNLTQTINEIDALYDVTVCAQGAFPQTDASLVASLKDAGAMLAHAREAGLVATHGSGETTGIAPVGEGAAVVAEPQVQGARDLAALKEWAEARYAQAFDSE